MTDSYTELTRRSVLKNGALATGALLVGGTAATGTAAAGIGDGRVAHYTLNNLKKKGKHKDEVHDASPYGNDGTAMGDVSVVKGEGRVGNAFEFDGDDDYVKIPDDDSLDVQEALTISFWFKLGGMSGDNEYSRTVSKGQSTGNNGAYGTWVTDTRDPSYVGLRFIDEQGNAHSVRERNAPNYDDGEWHHVAATYSNADDRARLYFDSDMRVNQTISGDVKIRSTDDDLLIGDGNGHRHFNGKLDEVRVYDRALSEEEIEELASMGED